jgi:mRNA-degrading endonuclease toxin of MazEF toxin-antitoxin module
VKRGAIHWGQTDKRRPLLIVSPDDRNELAGDVIVAIVTTKGRPSRWHVRLGRGEATLPTESMIKCEQLFTVPKAHCDRTPIGSLSEPRMREIDRALISALGIELPLL